MFRNLDPFPCSGGKAEGTWYAGPFGNMLLYVYELLLMGPTSLCTPKG